MDSFVNPVFWLVIEELPPFQDSLSGNLDAVALTLIGGVQHIDASGTRVRGESHLLLVGDPGL
jgi:hypothetical protein